MLSVCGSCFLLFLYRGSHLSRQDRLRRYVIEPYCSECHRIVGYVVMLGGFARNPVSTVQRQRVKRGQKYFAVVRGRWCGYIKRNPHCDATTVVCFI